MKRVIYLATNGFKIKRGGVEYSEVNKKAIPYDTAKDATEIATHIKLGYIKKIEIDETEANQPTQDTELARLNKLNKEQLADEAKSAGVEVASGMSKTEVIAKIIEVKKV